VRGDVVGQARAGAVDDELRHAITKLATLHFASTEEYRLRVIQLGEEPFRVFAVGALGLDAIRTEAMLSREELEGDLGFALTPPVALVTYHPETLGTGGAADFDELLAALDALPELRVVFTRPNADAGNRALAEALDAWVASRADRAAAFASLGSRRYLSLMRAADVVAGNSSSGILEAASFGTPVVDVGDRQRGRIRPENVIHAEPARDVIRAALEQALSPAFREAAARVTNPYGDGHAAERIVEVLSERLPGLTTRKRFHDLPGGADV
jgi:UDP-hydrolysing UDP-N-acetyl-D-glucosamine 2-epimerase